jgi:hypothetical protein
MSVQRTARHLLAATLAVGTLLMGVPAKLMGGPAKLAAQATDSGWPWPRRLPAEQSDLPAFLRFPGFVRQLHVAPTGADTSPGTAAAPLRTIAAALAAARRRGPGTEILVHAGTYRETVTIDFSGTPQGWYGLRGYPGERPVIAGSDGWELLHLKGASYVLVEGLELSGSKLGTRTQDGSWIGSREDLFRWGTRFQACLPSGENCGTGLQIGGNAEAAIHHVVVRDLVVHDFPGGGIQTDAADLLLIEHNLVHHNAHFSFYGHSGISVFQSKAAAGAGERPPHGIIVRRNVAYANHQHVPSTAIGWDRPTDGNGIIVDMGATHAYPHRTLVESNLVFDNGGSGIHTLRSDQVDIVNNTAFWNSANPAQDDGEIFANGSQGVRILNNILVARPGQRLNSNWDNRELQTAGNLLSGTRAPDVLGPNDLLADPRLKAPSTDLATADFTPLPGSPAIDHSRPPLLAATDLSGKPAIRTRDLGAIEAP